MADDFFGDTPQYEQYRLVLTGSLLPLESRKKSILVSLKRRVILEDRILWSHIDMSKALISRLRKNKFTTRMV